ncbi:MAG: YqgE/AlgH family protein [Pseudomonadota bacterium]
MTDHSQEKSGYLTGQLLIAMPNMRDSRFARTVIYLCAHNEDGAMGLVINRLVGAITFPDLLSQLGIEVTDLKEEIRVHFGGPVESGRGFVLHSGDYLQESTLQVNPRIALTATIDILRDIAQGAGPKKQLMALGYAGWGPGQLDNEIQANGWLHATADEELIFDNGLDDKWERAMAKLGVDISMLSGEAGHA